MQCGGQSMSAPSKQTDSRNLQQGRAYVFALEPNDFGHSVRRSRAFAEGVHIFTE